jgi:8-oxo-dGTP diphosphatase
MKSLHVVAAVIRNSKGETLLSKRLPNTIYAGLWEFPGGKRELNEPVFQTLKRELFEELGIEVTNARPLIHINHDYPDNKRIHLDIWQVEGWNGEPFGKENQEIQWITDFSNLTFLEANYPILKAVQLPPTIAITPEPNENFWYELEKTLETDIKIIQFRAHSLNKKTFCEYADKILKIAQPYRAKIVLNTDIELAEKLGSSAVHLNSQRLYDYDKRPVHKNITLSVSCHDLEDIKQAHKIDADLILLAPVKNTLSHPEKRSMGWFKFAQLTEQSKIPIYALGGMRKKDLSIAWAHGAQGIAAIRGLWQCR